MRRNFVYNSISEQDETQQSFERPAGTSTPVQVQQRSHNTSPQVPTKLNLINQFIFVNYQGS